MIEVIFCVAEYDQPKVYEAGFIPRSLLRNEKEFYRLDTPYLLWGASLREKEASPRGPHPGQFSSLMYLMCFKIKRFLLEVYGVVLKGDHFRGEGRMTASLAA